MNRPVRVLRVIGRMNVGGPALQVAGLARGLDPRQFDHRILTGTVDPGEEDYLALRAPDVEVVRVPGLGRSIRPSDDARALRALIAEIRRFRPDVVHTHTAKAGVLGRVAAETRPGTRTIHSFHGHLLTGYFGPARTRAVRAVEGLLARRTDLLVAVGRKVRDELIAAGVGRPDQYVVVPPGIDLPDPPSRVDARHALGLPPDVPIVAFVARLTQVKRPDRALRVFKELLRRQPDALLVVAGRGPLEKRMATDAEALGDRVRFLGWYANVEVVYASADVTLLTSDNEGMPVSLIEAAMCGCPAVTTNAGSAAEVVEDGRTGRVVAADALVHAVDELLSDEAARRRMGAQAAVRAERLFSVRRLVDDTAGLYLSLTPR